MQIKKEGKVFDRTIATQLYSQMDKDSDGNITQDEFIRVWMNCENSIREKIARNNEEIKKAKMCLEENELKSKEFKKKEDDMGRNKYQSASLTINVIEGQNVDFDKSNVTLTFKEQNFSTNFIDGNFPNYENQQFKFISVQPSDSINLFINDGFDENKNYSGVLNVKQFYDQKIHNVWIPMRGGLNTTKQSKLHIQVHYIYAKSLLAQEACEKWKELIDKYENKNESLKQDLINLYSPFDFLTSLNRKPAYFEEIKPIDKLSPYEAYEPKFQSVPPKPLHPIIKVALIFGLLLGIVSIAAMDYKHHLILDLCIVFFIITMYFLDFVEFNLISLLFTIVFLIVAIVIEIIWYLIYIKNWWSSVYIDDGSLVTFRQYQKWVSIVSLCLKGILLIVLFISIFLVKRKDKQYEEKNYQNFNKPLN